MAQKPKTGIGPLGAAALGAAIGAGAVILSDEKKREAIKKKVDDVVKRGEGMLTDIQHKVDEARTSGRKKLATELEKAKRQIDSDNKEVKTKKAD